MEKFWGKVISGKKRGKDLGFPTANVRLHKDIAEGIYFSHVRVGGKWFNALTFIGKAVTFNETEVSAESYLLDVDRNLYGKRITVELLQRLRDNKKFNTAEDLSNQMEKDLQSARKFFATRL